jgi:alpha-L-fucosidase
MNDISRRDVLKLLATAGAGAASAPAQALPPGFGEIKGPFQPTWGSLSTREIPEWYRDVKFGIWAHWGPQCQPEQGDWYAMNMYNQNHVHYKFHVQKYGHPSKFGFKDVCNEHSPKKIAKVKMLHAGRLKFTRDASGLTIQLPDKNNNDYASAFKITHA